MKFDGLKDSGKREDMDTGSRRDTQDGKSRPDLMNPLVARRVGMHYMNGCKKYGEKNFELGQKSSRYLASLERHLLDYKEGKKDEDHLAAIVWNANCLIMNQEFVERGIYDEEILDETNYETREGFWSTVGARALAFNEDLRKKEAQESDDPKLLEIIDSLCECQGEPMETRPPCLDCSDDDCCSDCPSRDECDHIDCPDCKHQDECLEILRQPVKPSYPFKVVHEHNGCAGCYYRTEDIKHYREWPCTKCTRNKLNHNKPGVVDKYTF